jgi:hypothetical protein
MERAVSDEAKLRRWMLRQAIFHNGMVVLLNEIRSDFVSRSGAEGAEFRERNLLSTLGSAAGNK